MSDQEALVVLGVLLILLLIVGLYFLFEIRINRILGELMWGRFEKRTGIKRPNDWREPLRPVTQKIT